MAGDRAAWEARGGREGRRAGAVARDQQRFGRGAQMGQPIGSGKRVRVEQGYKFGGALFECMVVASGEPQVAIHALVRPASVTSGDSDQGFHIANTPGFINRKGRNHGVGCTQRKST